jgi:hypothetical protein
LAASDRASNILSHPGTKKRLGYLLDHPPAPCLNVGHFGIPIDGPDPAPVQPAPSSPQSAELSPEELRGIIAEGCRSNDPATKRAAIAQALKLYDATPKAADPVADPARLVEFLACGGGGQETLGAVLARLVSIYGVSAMRAASLSIIAQSLPIDAPQVSTPQYIVV